MESKRKRARIVGPDKVDPGSLGRKSKALPSSQITIEIISDKELLIILSLLSLADLVSLERVNRRWRWLVLKACQERTSLSLTQKRWNQHEEKERFEITHHWFFADYCTRHWCRDEDSLRVNRRVRSNGIQRIGAKFPNLTQLELYFVDHISIGCFVKLMKLYPKLECLTIFSSPTQQKEYHCRSFWNALRPLESLRNLLLPIHYNEDLIRMLALWNIGQITSRLNSIYFKSELRFDSYSAKSLNKLLLDKLSARGLRIGVYNLLKFPMLDTLDMAFAYYHLLPEMVDGSPPAETGMSLCNREYDGGCHRNEVTDMINEQLDFMIQNDEHYDYTQLNLGMPGDSSLFLVLSNISKFPYLTHFRLSAYYRRDYSTTNLFSPQLSPSNYRTKLINCTVPSVTVLHLYGFAIYSASQLFLYLPVIFPNLQVIHLEDCPLKDSNGKQTSARWLARSLRRFPQLTLVYYNYRLVVRLDRTRDEDRIELERMVEKIEDEMYR